MPKRQTHQRINQMKNGKIVGWDFTRGYNADGQSTLDTLAAEKKRLEARLVQIPKLIADLENELASKQFDVGWLESLSKNKRKQWEKEKGKTVEAAVLYAKQRIVGVTGEMASLNAEKSRIPAQISAIQNQLDTLVKGESTGLEKGIDRETAKELGQIELQKERNKMAHERALREAELKAQQARTQQAQVAQQQEAAKERTAAEAAAKSKTQTAWIIGAGIVLLLGLLGWIIYKRKMALKLKTV